MPTRYIKHVLGRDIKLQFYDIHGFMVHSNNLHRKKKEESDIGPYTSMFVWVSDDIPIQPNHFPKNKKKNRKKGLSKNFKNNF